MSGGRRIFLPGISQEFPRSPRAKPFSHRFTTVACTFKRAEIDRIASCHTMQLIGLRSCVSPPFRHFNINLAEAREYIGKQNKFPHICVTALPAGPRERDHNKRLMASHAKSLSAPYVVLLSRNGEHRYTFHQSEDDVCAFVLSLFEQHRVQEVQDETSRAAAAASRKGLSGAVSGNPEVVQYTANDVLDHLDLNIGDIQVLIKQQNCSNVDGSRGDVGKSQRPTFLAHDVDWVKSAVCQYLVRCLPSDDIEDEG